ncbi:MAG: PD40 domain-containing protein [Planctomycetes bacterium]|nr:PD40 domain-containing protein [Planctomycetota bacterium]
MKNALRIAFRLRIVLPAAALAAAFALIRPSPAPDPALLAALREEGSLGGRASIVRIELAARPASPRPIASGFDEAGAPSVSFDGRRAVFAGRRAAGEPSEVWEASVAGSAARQVTRGGECLDPCYLPDGRIAYARAAARNAWAAATLRSCLADGTGERQVTFGEAHDRSPAVLPDGRIAFRRSAVGGDGPGRVFAVSPDGTGAVLLCEAAPDASVVAGPWVVGSQILFAEGPRGEKLDGSCGAAPAGPRLVAVSAGDPRGGRRVLAGPEALSGAASGERFASVSGLPGGGLAASVLGPGGGSLRRFPGGAQDEVPGLAGHALAAERQRPLNLTSVVDEGNGEGTLLCVDVRASRFAQVAGAELGAIRKVRVLGEDGLELASAPVAPDGSFLVQVPADKPLRLELLGPGGVIAKDESGFWVRPNESRACIGCHEDPELSPENRVPLALGEAAAPAAAADRQGGVGPGGAGGAAVAERRRP